MLNFFTFSSTSKNGRNTAYEPDYFNEAFKKELRRESRQAINQLLKDIDTDTRREIRRIISAAFKELESSLTGNYGQSSGTGLSLESLDAMGEGQWQNAISKSLGAILDNQVVSLLGSERTKTNTHETTRSQEIADRFNESKTQKRAAQQRSAAAGNRNL